MTPRIYSSTKLGVRTADTVFPALVVLGLIVPVVGLWRLPVEIALIPTLAWLAWRHGLGGRRAALALALPLAWIAWLGASGGWGSESAREEWDHHSLAAFMTALFFVSATIYVRAAPAGQLTAAAVVMVLAAMLTLSSGIAFHLAGPSIASERLAGLGLFDPQNTGSFIATFIGVVAIHLVFEVRDATLRMAMQFYIAVAVLHVFMAGSRGGLVILPVVLATYLFCRDRQAAGRSLLVGGTGFFAVLAGAMILVPDLREFLATMVARENYRVEIWRESWRLSLEHPLLGVGIGDDTVFSGQFSHPHNLLLSSLFFGGIPAMLLGLLTLVMGFLLARRIADPPRRALAVAAAMLLVLSTLAHGSLPISKPASVWYSFWLPLALIWGLALREREST